MRTPKCLEAEQSLLGTIMHNPQAIHVVKDMLSPDDFFDSRNKLLYETLLKLSASGEPADLVMLSDALFLCKEEGIITYASTLYAYNDENGPLEAYARVIKKKSTLRKALVKAAEIGKLIEGGLDPDKVSETLISVAKQINYESSDLVSVSEAIETLTNEENLIRTETGIIDFDRINGGLACGELMVLAGRPSMGKTMLALNIARHSLVKRKTVGFFSLEMTPGELAKRILLLENSIGSKRDPRKFMLHMSSPGPIGTAKIRAYLEGMKTQGYEVALVIVDYLQLMDLPPDMTRYTRRDEQISYLTRDLKLIAGEFSVPIILLSQLNRECEKRKNHRPILSDLRESGSIEQDADIIAFLYRDEIYNKLTNDRGIAELIIAKYRNAEAGITIKLLFEPHNCRFRNMVLSKVEPPF